MVEKRFGKLKRYLKSPVVLTTLISLILVYTVFPVKKDYGLLLTLCPEEEILGIKGKILSNPQKNFQKGTYSCFFESSEVFSKNGSFSSSGKVKVIFPESLSEALFPGKLYSEGKKYTFSENEDCKALEILEKNKALSEVLERNSTPSEIILENGSPLILLGKMKTQKFIVSKVIPLSWEDSLFSRFKKIRALSRLSFRRCMYAWKEAGFLFMALLSGIRDVFPEKIQDSFRLSGLSHILALSGMHLSLFSGIVAFLFKKKLCAKIVLIIQAIFSIFFIWFAGRSPSLFRAFLFSSIFALTSFVDIKNVDNLKVLSLCFLLQISFFPEDIHSLAFILSYGALSGILLFSEKISSILDSVLPPFLSSGLSGSLSAQAFTSPVSLFKLGTFSPVGIAATLVVSPLISAFIYSGLVLFILTLIFPFLSSSSAFFMNILYNIIVKLVSIFSKFPCINLN